MQHFNTPSCVTEAEKNAIEYAQKEFKKFFCQFNISVIEHSGMICASLEDVKLELKLANRKKWFYSVLAALDINIGEITYTVALIDMDHPEKNANVKYRFDNKEDMRKYYEDRDRRTRQWLDQIRNDKKITIGFAPTSKYRLGDCSGLVFGSFERWLQFRFNR
jgi:hypothetical protein